VEARGFAQVALKEIGDGPGGSGLKAGLRELLNGLALKRARYRSVAATVGSPRILLSAGRSSFGALECSNAR
jgi:hypothetical protein